MDYSPLAKAEFAPMVACFAMACAASRAHSDLSAAALARYGDHGALISGCTRDHFPELIKDQLRALSRQCGYWNDRAREARPPRVRGATVTHIARLVATRDGVGRYGYAAYRESE